MRVVALVVLMLAVIGLASAQESVSQKAAAEFIRAAFTQSQVSLFNPGESGSEQFAPIKKKEDVQKLESLIVASIENSDGMVLGCWNPHHAIRVKRGEEITTIHLCFECVRGHYWVNGRIYWFTIARKQEADMNELFHRYGLPGSKS